MRTSLNIHDPLFISAPNGGGLLYAHRHLLVPLTYEDTTGLALTDDGMVWCVQADGSRSFREIRQGILNSVTIAQEPRDLHDVLVGKDGIYAVFTETNQVVRLDEAFQVQESWSFGEEPDCAHVNCIALHDGQVIASMFGTFSSHRGYKGETRQAGRVVDVRSGKLLIDGLSQPHSLVVVGDQLWLCSSEDRAVHIYDRHCRLERKVMLPGYTRGLAVGEKFVYVGLSRSRNLKAGEVGEFSTAVIGVLDRESLAVTGYLPIPSNEIYDIRIASSADLVTDVMASTWVHERGLHQAELAQAARKLNEVEEDLGQSGRALQATRSELDQVTQQAAVAATTYSTELARVAHEAALTAAASNAELARVTQVAEVTAAASNAELARVAQMAAMTAAASNAELTRVTQRAAETEAARLAAEKVVEALQVQQIEARGEIAKRNARIRMLEQVRDELDLIRSSRSWRWTRPMRFALRLLRHGGLGDADRAKLRGLLHRDDVTSPEPSASLVDPLQVMPVIEPRTHLAPQADGKRDVFVWSVIDWHFRIQRPQHLARELAAAGHRVFYISNNFIDRAEPGFAIESLDGGGRLFQIQLHLKGSPAIYHAIPTPDAQQQLRASIGQLLAWTRSWACLSLVQHPYWLEAARILPNQRLTYDCMDHHGGFADNSPDVLARELDLMRTADLLVVTSDWLHEEAGKHNRQLLMVRNACQYEHFATHPERIFQDPQGRRVIGYYGAIAEWFDLDLLEQVARQFPDCLVLMIGADTTGAKQHLQHLANVEFTGEVPYATLPFYLAGFDVCLLPFQVIPLTLATNPVKVYEYLSAGKEVVSIALPEIRQFGELVRTGTDHASFVDAVGAALAATPDPAVIARRQQFAAEQTWAHRVHDLVQGVDTLPEPRVSVIVVTYNNLDLTKLCLRSLELYSDYANLEVIVVDNASADDTPAYLQAWAASGKDRQIILNPDNRGFAAANNQGLAVASGEYLVLLNNDTHVTPGWIASLVAHLRYTRTLGMIGPVTNNIGNEARIDISYDDMDGMLHAAADYTTRHAGQLTPLRTAAFFCVMMRRSVYEKVGPLDEAFGIGFFEDDDYCRRVDQAGWAIACADDVFVHHNLSASFNKLKQETRQALFEQNKVTYEAKWGAWVPHKYRGQ
ncbi:glycosyltransferase [Rhodanobacter sp. C03]|uniref:glycosyltransferase n=1 Tax=Rhodanobacter sp. C03 TaxID=1945858 RepID=UPI00111584B1|nr:glycosyltransferase [Rhodanobacter sp. C03]